jgi:hypothetical protein
MVPGGIPSKSITAKTGWAFVLTLVDKMNANTNIRAKAIMVDLYGRMVPFLLGESLVVIIRFD